MKKSFLLLLIIFLGGMETKSQTILYQDEFESYAADSYLAASNPEWWTTWEGLPGTPQDAMIKNTYGHSGTKSFNVTSNGGNTDLS